MIIAIDPDFLANQTYQIPNTTMIDISDSEPADMLPPPAKKQRTGGTTNSKNNGLPPHLASFIPPTVAPLLKSKIIALNEQKNNSPNNAEVPAKNIKCQSGGQEKIKSIHDSYTYVSKIPSAILEAQQENYDDGDDDDDGNDIILGIDEAGRGPVLGPMVYSLAYCMKKNLKILSDYDFDDSKKLTDFKRTELLHAICGNVDNDSDTQDDVNVLQQNIGYAITNLTARDISSEMLNLTNFNNLNNQAHETTIALIAKTLTLLQPKSPNNSNVVKQPKVTHVYIDTVGPPTTYQEKLSKIFPSLKVTVAKKADSLYPIVSAASVVAKVTRDIILRQYNLLENQLAATQGLSATQYGSGYPSDPRTTAWLHGRINPLLGWDQVVRYSWQTTKTVLLNHSKVGVIWEDDIRMKKIDYGNGNGKAINAFFKKNDNGDDELEQKSKLDNLEVSTLWYGENVTSI